MIRTNVDLGCIVACMSLERGGRTTGRYSEGLNLELKYKRVGHNYYRTVQLGVELGAEIVNHYKYNYRKVQRGFELGADIYKS